MTYDIRLATADDIEAIRSIELAAGTLFAEIGMLSIAEDEPPSAAELMAHIEDRTAWVAIRRPSESAAEPVGFALASIVDGEGHLDQVSVHPDHGRRGIGSRLIEQVTGWTRDQRLTALTLTTFVDVAFNGPYYRSLGFEPVDAAAIGPELHAIRQAEVEAGIDVAPRTAMIRHLDLSG